MRDVIGQACSADQLRKGKAFILLLWVKELYKQVGQQGYKVLKEVESLQEIEKHSFYLNILEHIFDYDE